jgi:NADH:ubiquinone oxidoreductase subunit K
MENANLLWHVAGFAAPALCMAVGVVGLAGVFSRRSVARLSWAARMVINFAACLGVLALGLILTGHDGRMLTYAALALTSASVESLLSRGGVAR